MPRRLRAQKRWLEKSPAGAQSFGFGARVGYWPCLRAPYVQFTLLFWHFDVWFGDESYKATRDKRDYLRHLVDVVWGEATGTTNVPSTPWADRLIAVARLKFQ